MPTDDPERTAVIADLQPLWLDALERLLRDMAVTVIGRAGSADALLALPALPEADVVVFDSSLGDEPAALVLEIKRRTPASLVALSIDSAAPTIEQLLSSGAAVVAIKTAEPADLASAVRQAFNRSVFVSFRPNAPPQPGPEPLLTRRELEILSLVAEGLSNASMAKMLWVTEQTVKFHLSNIYRKLGVANRTEAARWAQVHGVVSTTAVVA